MDTKTKINPEPGKDRHRRRKRSSRKVSRMLKKLIGRNNKLRDIILAVALGILVGVALLIYIGQQEVR